MKQRHIKTFQEKFGIRSVLSEYNATFKEHRKLEYKDDVSLFSKLPYLGYLYVDAVYDTREFWYDTNLDRIRTKVIEVNEHNVILSMIDDHNGGIALITAKTNHARIKGNVLILI